ncbi:MAG: glycosyltransferase family protein [Pirellulaceae bacterium]|nr:glycosyltransferase family protein [Pirellulaceae bacterium]
MSSLQSELSRGWKIHQQQRPAEAEQIYRRVIALQPNDANAWCYLGIALHDQRHYQQAVESYQRALQLQSKFPIALNNLGNSLRYVGQFEEADQCFQKAITLQPNYFNAYKNRGTLHAWNGNLDLALQYYGQALELSPQDAELHRNLGVIYLLQGRFAEGWTQYRWRWRVGDLNRLPSIPVWDGTHPSGKAILLTAEQGLGDTLQFVRFAEILRQRGAKTLIHCQAALMALLQNNANLGPVYPNNLAVPQPMDVQCSLLDVADLLQLDLPTIPGMAGYIQPTQNLRQYWQATLPKSPGQFRIGIAWQGNPDHQADLYRSCPLSEFEAIARIDGVQLVSLQKGFGSQQLDQWRGPPIMRLDDSTDTSSGAFMDTAAIMQSLDLVITSDTAIAHLGGALGVPTWIVLSFVPDWRWLLQRSDSPWYPSVRLFRQPSAGDWTNVFAAVERALVDVLKSARSLKGNP